MDVVSSLRRDPCEWVRWRAHPVFTVDPDLITEHSALAGLLVRGATIWSCGPQGILQEADLLVQGGKIVQVGRGLAVPRGATVVEAEGGI